MSADMDFFATPFTAIKNGFYSDSYFLRTREIMLKDNYNPQVLMQVFQRKQAILCGMKETINIIKECSFNADKLIVKALQDGDRIAPWEPVLTIEGNLADFVHLETVYLGILSRQTKIATNANKVVAAANNKPVMFFPSRFDYYLTQVSDGYAAKIGGMCGVSTPANAKSFGTAAMGTIPHALISAYNGDTVAATMAFDKYIDEGVNRIALVDFDNDCVNTALAVARELKGNLWGVRLDTSDTLVDNSILSQMGSFKPTGVCEQLVRNVRRALDEEGFNHVKIIASGGFTAEKIMSFEEAQVPVDCYAVGASLFNDNINYTADVVVVNGQPCAKTGRRYFANQRLQAVEL